MKDKVKSILFFSALFLILDQVIKVFISSKMVVNQSVILIRNLFSITLIHNTGAAFSLLTGSRLLLIGIGIAALIGLFIYVNTLEVIDDLDIFTYALLFGGILGNLVDRIIHGYVIDFFSLNFGNYSFPIFNIADICIVLSIVIILGRMVKESLWK